MYMYIQCSIQNLRNFNMSISNAKMTKFDDSKAPKDIIKIVICHRVRFCTLGIITINSTHTERWLDWTDIRYPPALFSVHMD